ncbi:hypothetical protein C7B79_14810 [Chroococcidiopsis cubana CCALA 043]|nr:hypothetical protein C7B79_14810 [Chroococcidiopsis cubana CCALA 043]PSM48220.1 hypothetical protein C7Y66_15525 [Chroococcidiopsis sp. CCALA 051]
MRVEYFLVKLIGYSFYIRILLKKVIILLMYDFTKLACKLKLLDREQKIFLAKRTRMIIL